LRWRSGDAPALAFDAAEGYATLLVGDKQLAWRSFSQWNRERTQKVAVMLLLEERDALAHDIAGQMIEPGLWLLPVVALALGLAIARGLQPLVQLSEEVAELDVQRADSLVARHPLREFDSVVNSINTLLARQQQALRRERRLASEVAHELRTPLTSIVLQVQALEANPALQSQSEALARIRAETLRAGHVLNQLLALARSSRGAERTALECVDLSMLARTVAAEYAQAAWELADAIEVDAPVSICVQGQPVLLEIALRNLVENALRHTPHGTRISIQCAMASGTTATWLQVCDDGQRSGAVREPAPTDSLHLGHEIVSRVSAEHGARFLTVPADSPWTTCYRIAFVADVPRAAG
jgi:two-component system sensor histidine kinase QseC